MTTYEFQYAFLGDELQLAQNIRVELDPDNRIVEIDEHHREIKNNLLLMPGLFNAHVHAGDIGLRGVSKDDLASLVGEGGIKHTYLNNLNEQELEKSLLQSLHEAEKAGTMGWADFREGGLKGLQPYPLSERGTHIPFGRPARDEVQELHDIAQIGFRDVVVFPVDDMIQIAEAAKELKKRIFIHASEDLHLRERWEREHGYSDVAWAIDHLQVDSIIHLTHASSDDIDQMVDAKVGGVVCLTSNQFTSVGIPPVEEMVNASIKLGIGTDNAMFTSLSLWEEMHALSKYAIDPHRLLSMACNEGANLAGLDWGVSKGGGNIIAVTVPTAIAKLELFDWIVSECTAQYIFEKWRLL
ncbi:MAG: amidohydrolase family protein [Candidatus Kariarchaeaceae archaeon]|jgi:cytosine/adenosine deaminase-related metal-dependent hydrolase